MIELPDRQDVQGKWPAATVRDPDMRRTDPRFDGLTRLAAHLLGVPSTALCLTVGGRHQVRGVHGRSPRWNDVVGARLAERVVFEGGDWFAGQADDQGGSYLGAPLVGDDGAILGVLVVFSPEARQWSDDDIRSLTDLTAHAAMTIAGQAARDRAEAHLNIQRTVGGILSKAVTLDGAIGPLLDAVVEAFGFEVGEFWVPDAGSGELRRHGRDCIHGPDGPAFSASSQALVFRRGEGFPGRIWEEREPAWIEVADQDRDFHRAAQAVAAGLRTAVGLPIIGDSRLLGVMTFLASRIIGRDELLLHTLKTLGRQIGEFAVRSGVDAEVMGLNNRLSALLDAASHVAIIATDVRGMITTFNTGAENMLGYSREEMIGRRTPEVIHLRSEIERHAERLREEYGVTLSGFDVFTDRARRGEHDEQEWTYLRKDGEPLTVSLTVTAVRDALGGIVGFLGIAKDISQRKLAEREARKFAALVEHSGDFIAMTTIEGRVSYVNPAGRALVGFDEVGINGLSMIADFLEEPDRSIIETEVIPATLTSGRWFGEVRLRRFPDNETIEGEANMFLVGGSEPGRPLGLGMIIRDSRARKRAEAMLLDSGARLRGILESSLDGLVTINHEGRIIEFNPAAERILGWSRGAALGRKLESLMIPQEYHAAYETGLRRYLETGKGSVIGRRVEFEALRRDGSRFPVEVAVSVVRTFGPPIFTASLRDISDRKRVEARLLESERRFRGCFDYAPIGMAMVGLDGRWIQVNRALCEIVGYSEEELLKRDFQGITHPDDLDTDMEQMAALLAGKVRSQQSEKRYIHQHGHEVWVILAASLVRDADGNPLYFVSQIEDITLKKQAMEALQRAKEDAEAASRAKAAFLANMSHEVRTPMAAVLGYADMLLDPTLGPEDRDQTLQAIRRNGAHLMQVINDVLDLSKIEAGRMDLDLIDYGPWQVLLEVVSLLQIRADERGVRIETHALNPLPVVGIMDPTRLRQVLMNLVSNAIKFTEPGGRVDVRVAVDLSADPGVVLLRFEVEDSGIGMTPAQIDQLFTPFQQADTTTTRRFGGTGLGLSICHRLVSAMGGRIEVRSEPGRGSVFAVQVPLAFSDEIIRWLDPGELVSGVPDTALSNGPGPRRFFEGRVLVVEDSVEIRRILAHSLQRMGLEVEEAANGRIGVERALAGSFDLILMDMQMPELDGYGASSSIRRSGLQVPIVALTAHAMAEDRERSLRAGCDDYLTKPVASKTLAAMLAKYLRSPVASAQPGGPGDGGSEEMASPEAQEELSDLIREFATTLPAKADQLRSFLDAGDLDRLSSLAHQVRGVAGMYGFPDLTETAGLIEDSVREGQELDLISGLLEEFAEEVARINLEEERAREPRDQFELPPIVPE